MHKNGGCIWLNISRMCVLQKITHSLCERLLMSASHSFARRLPMHFAYYIIYL